MCVQLSMVILSLKLIQEGQLLAEEWALSTALIVGLSLLRKSMVRLIDHHNMIRTQTQCLYYTYFILGTTFLGGVPS